MQATYGEEWQEKVTDDDLQQLQIYSPEEQTAYARYKAIETEAMTLSKKGIKKLLRQERLKEKEVSIFRLIKARAIIEYPQYGEREIHKAVYSFDLLYFLMRNELIMMFTDIVKGVRGKRNESQKTVNTKFMEAALAAVGKIVEGNRRRAQKKLLKTVSHVDISYKSF